MNNLNIFVSSTCYDLSQIRADLSDFINSNGHQPILSEFENFPINPQKNTIDNCINIVKENADILVLIVGNRYGSTIDDGKSITNLEYLTAKKKGIPIFVFIDRKTLNTFYFWKENKNGNFSTFVDSTKIFEFIAGIRENSQVWTFEFDKAQDIISILKTQLSYLFKDSLKIRARYELTVPEYFQMNLSNEALKILIDKNSFFESHFFIQTLVDEIKKKEVLNNDFKYKIHYGSKTFIKDLSEIPNWIIASTASIMNLIDSIANLFIDAFPVFFNDPGKPSDIYGLYYISRTYANLYEHLINWAITIRTVSVPETCVELRNKLADLSNKTIKDCWEYPFSVQKEFEQLRQNISEGNQSLNLKLYLRLEIAPEDKKAFDLELEEFKKIILSH